MKGNLGSSNVDAGDVGVEKIVFLHWGVGILDFVASVCTINIIG
jgi:hypothetical protein